EGKVGGQPPRLPKGGLRERVLAAQGFGSPEPLEHKPDSEHRSRRQRRGGQANAYSQRRVAPAPARQPLERADPSRLDRSAGEISAQVGGQGVGPLVAARRLFLQARQADRLQITRSL